MTGRPHQLGKAPGNSADEFKHGHNAKGNRFVHPRRVLRVTQSIERLRRGGVSEPLLRGRRSRAG